MDRFVLNKAPKNEKARIAYREGKRRLEEGAFCDDCKEVGSTRKAVMFVLMEAPAGDFDFFLTMLCAFHADLFAAKKTVERETVIKTDKSKAEMIVTDTKIVKGD